MISRPYFGIYYAPWPGSSEAILCEVDGGICYEAYRTEAEAQAVIDRDMRGESGKYIVKPISSGVVVRDRELDHNVTTGPHEPVYRPLSPAQKNLAKLPARCAAVEPSSGAAIMIVAGEHGYHPLPASFPVDGWNDRHGVTPAQAEAMLVGSMFGWEVPGADPDQYGDLDLIAPDAQTEG